jgi:hypothetical protein
VISIKPIESGFGFELRILSSDAPIIHSNIRGSRYYQ